MSAAFAILANPPPLYVAIFKAARPPVAESSQRLDRLGQKVTLNLPNALRGGATAVPEKRLAKLITLRRSVRLKA